MPEVRNECSLLAELLALAAAAPVERAALHHGVEAAAVRLVVHSAPVAVRVAQEVRPPDVLAGALLPCTLYVASLPRRHRVLVVVVGLCLPSRHTAEQIKSEKNG